MSIIQTIRDKGSWVIFVLLGLSLIAFIFMDAGRRNSLFGGSGSKNTIGSVNGSSLKRDVYNARVEVLKKIYSDNRNISESQITGYVWNSMVTEKLMKDEISKLDFDMPEKDLVDFALGKYGQASQHMPAFYNYYFKQYSIVDQMNQLNYQKAIQVYNQVLKRGDGSQQSEEAIAYFKTLLDMVKPEFLMVKHGQIMNATVYVPMWMAKKEMADNNTMANISFVHVPYTDISDSIPEMKVTDQDLINYMEKRKNQYQQVETRVIDYTVFDFNPTSSDSNALAQSLLLKKEEFRAAKDSLTANFLISNNSLSQYTNQYVRKKDLKIKGDSAGFIQGAVFGPYVDDQGYYTVAKIADVKMLNDSVSARHILIKTTDPQTRQVIHEEQDAKMLMDSIVKLYRSGVPFDSLARKFTEDVASRDSGGMMSNIALNSTVPEFNDFIFTKNPGDTGVVRTVFGYHFIQVISKKGVATPAYKVGYLSKAIDPSKSTRDSASQLATSFAAATRTSAAFDDYFVKNPTKQKLTSREVSKETEMIDNTLPRARELVRWMYNAKLNDVSEPIPFDKDRKIVVAKLKTITPEGLQSPQTARMGLESIIRNERKYDMLSKKYPGGSTLEEIATKTGKQVVVQDSLSFETASLKNISTEPRVAGASLNPAYQAKISGPIRGNAGIYFIKVNGQPFAKPNASTDAEAARMQMLQLAQRNLGSRSEQVFRYGAKIKDNRLETGN